MLQPCYIKFDMQGFALTALEFISSCFDLLSYEQNLPSSAAASYDPDEDHAEKGGIVPQSEIHEIG